MIAMLVNIKDSVCACMCVYVAKVAKVIQWGKDSVFNVWCWNNFMSSLCTKINLKWIIDLNVRARITKFLENVIEETLCDLGKSKFLFFRNGTKRTINKL